ncbi:uncharacterized protein LOC110504351 [Oncorhynchus mykiss]|uniref:uncharacterized protein LOC110504351 n=1 Tax=Oncorhynchus mykiss TaxID=8022 RepID=UPI001878FAD9|nr:uncharacterized protein LOC110504351 [Oncorhynchus mykiss]
MRSGHHEVGHIDNPMKVRLNHGYGCRFEGEFTINKVPGNFYVSTHSATAQPQSPEMTHLIHKLAFGEKPLEYVAYSHTGRIIPAIWYRYDLSPISQVHREETTPLPVHNYDLCYHRGDVHGSRHHRLLYIHSLRGLEEDPDRKDVPRTYHYAVPRTYHYAVPRTYHYAVPRTYHYAVPRTYHYAVPRTYHYAVPRTYHYAVPRTYHYAVPRTYHYAVPRTYHYAPMKRISNIQKGVSQ